MTMFLNTLKYTFKIAIYFEKFYFKIHFNHYACIKYIRQYTFPYVRDNKSNFKIIYKEVRTYMGKKK